MEKILLSLFIDLILDYTWDKRVKSKSDVWKI